MADDKPEPRLNARSLDDTVAGTGPGIADDVGTSGEAPPAGPSDEEVKDAARKLGAPVPKA